MAGLERKKLIISVFIFFVVSYLIFLYPLFTKVEYLNLLDILFLNFSKFEAYELEAFNPRFLILFMIMFYVMYHQQISIISENASFLSMSIHKRKKKDIIITILKESSKDGSIIFLASIASMLFVTIVSYLITGVTMDVQYIQIMKISIYIMRFLLYIFCMVILLRISGIINALSYYMMIPYLGLTLFLMSDFVLGTSLVTISNSLYSELTYLFIIVILNVMVIIILYNKIRKTKEIYND